MCCNAVENVHSALATGECGLARHGGCCVKRHSDRAEAGDGADAELGRGPEQGGAAVGGQQHAAPPQVLRQVRQHRQGHLGLQPLHSTILHPRVQATERAVQHVCHHLNTWEMGGGCVLTREVVSGCGLGNHTVQMGLGAWKSLGRGIGVTGAG
eukprot:1726175-Rhodomonas_salina.1